MKLKLLTALLISLLAVSCSSDDDKTPSTNSVKMNGESFKIISASMGGVSIDESGHTLISLTNGTSEEISTISMDVSSYTRETIAGTYSYPENETDKLLDDWLTNYTVVDGTTISASSNLESGSITITHNEGDNYTIEMELTMIDETTFSGTYTGDFFVVFNNVTTD